MLWKPCFEKNTRENTTVLRSRFPEQVISRFGDIEGPARSPDLSPLDFLLWRYLKGRVYRENPTTFGQLKEVIQIEIRLISPEMTSAVLKTGHVKTCRILHRVKRAPYEEYHLQEVVQIKSRGFRNPMLALIFYLVHFIKSY